VAHDRDRIGDGLADGDDVLAVEVGDVGREFDRGHPEAGVDQPVDEPPFVFALETVPPPHHERQPRARAERPGSDGHGGASTPEHLISPPNRSGRGEPRHGN